MSPTVTPGCHARSVSATGEDDERLARHDVGPGGRDIATDRPIVRHDDDRARRYGPDLGPDHVVGGDAGRRITDPGETAVAAVGADDVGAVEHDDQFAAAAAGEVIGGVEQPLALPLERVAARPASPRCSRPRGRPRPPAPGIRRP